MNSRKPSHDSLRLFRLFRTGSAPGDSVCFPMRWSLLAPGIFTLWRSLRGLEHPLVHPAQGAGPGGGQGLEGGAGGHAVGRVPLGGVVDVPAQGAHPLAPGGLLLRGVHRHGTQGGHAPGVIGHGVQVGLGGGEEHPEGLLGRGVPQALQEGVEHGGGLAAPAVGPEGPGGLPLQIDGVDGGEHVPHRLGGGPVDGGGAHQEHVGLVGLLGAEGQGRLRHVSGAHLIPLLLQGLHGGVGQGAGAAVGGGIHHKGGAAGLGGGGGPGPVVVLGPGDGLGEAGAVAGAHQVGLGHLVQAGEHVGLEGAEDAGVVVGKLPLVGRPVVDVLVQHGGLAEVAAQEVAGEEGLARAVPGEHGVGPVEHGGGDELQYPVPQVQGVSGGHGAAGQVQVGDVLQMLGPRLGGDDLNLGAQLHQPGHAAGVVGLVVVHDQVVHPLQGEHLADVVHILVEVVGVDRLDQHVLLPGEEVGVVGGAVFGLHDDVEHPQGGVEHPHEPEVFLQLNGAHGGFFLSFFSNHFLAKHSILFPAGLVKRARENRPVIFAPPPALTFPPPGHTMGKREETKF